MVEISNEDGEWVSVSEAARRAGMSHPGIRNRMARGKVQWRQSPTTGFREVWVPQNGMHPPVGRGAGPRLVADDGSSNGTLVALCHQLEVKDAQIDRLIGLLESALGRSRPDA